MDFSKLSPAPWHGNVNTITREGGELFCHADLEFIALARKAFDVMVRRGWYPVRQPDGKWTVCTNGRAQYFPPLLWDSWRKLVFSDPFTALCDADEWYREKVEATA